MYFSRDFTRRGEEHLEVESALEQMNDYRLKVTGLKVGRYEVRLRGVKVADYSAIELSGGVNLAPAVLATGPITDQVKGVWAAIKGAHLRFALPFDHLPSQPRSCAEGAPGEHAPGEHAPGEHAPGEHAPGEHAPGGGEHE